MAVISYEPFWQTLKKKNISQYYLVHTLDFSTGTLDSIRKGKNLNLSTIDSICKLLDVDSISEIVEYIPEPQST